MTVTSVSIGTLGADQSMQASSWAFEDSDGSHAAAITDFLRDRLGEPCAETVSSPEATVSVAGRMLDTPGVVFLAGQEDRS